MASQTGSAGVFTHTLLEGCQHHFAVRSADGAGNIEPLNNDQNTSQIFVVFVSPCADAQSGDPGAEIIRTLQVTNTGDLIDTFDATLGDHTRRAAGCQ